MGLANLNLRNAANAGSVMTVMHPIDRTPLIAADGAPVTITLLGTDSDAYIAADRANRAKAVDRNLQQAKWSAAEQDLLEAEKCAKVTTSWHGVPMGWINGDEHDEGVAEFSEDMAVRLYTNPGTAWLFEQVAKHIGNRANFLKA